MFKDSQGNEWHPKLTLGRLISFQRLSGRDLLKDVYALYTAGQDELRGKNDLGAALFWLRYLFRDVQSITQFMFALVEPEAKERGITFDQFAENFGIPEMEQVILSLSGAISDFSQRHEKMAPGLVEKENPGQSTPVFGSQDVQE